MKTYQAFTKTKETDQLVNTEVRAYNKKDAQKWFKENTLEHETIHLK